MFCMYLNTCKYTVLSKIKIRGIGQAFHWSIQNKNIISFSAICITTSKPPMRLREGMKSQFTMNNKNLGTYSCWESRGWEQGEAQVGRSFGKVR